MQRAEVNVEVCHVQEQGKSTTMRQTRGKGKKRSEKTRALRKQPKPVDSDVETTEAVISGWEDEDELNASQYLQGDDQGSTLVRKRSVEGTAVGGTELGNKPAAKRRRTSMHEAD
jgi:hypothetical protein